MTETHISKLAQAFAALMLAVLALVAVAAPIVGAAKGFFEKTRLYSGRLDAVSALEDRLLTERQAIFLNLHAIGATADEVDLISDGEEMAKFVETTCRDLAQALTDAGAQITQDCALDNAPLNERLSVYRADLIAQNDIESLIAGAEGLGDDPVRLERFELSAPQPGAPANAARLSIRFSRIGANAGKDE